MAKLESFHFREEGYPSTLSESEWGTLEYFVWHAFSPQLNTGMQNHCICPYSNEFPGIFSAHLELIFYTDHSYTLIFLKCFLGPVRSTVHVLNDNINQSDGVCVSV